MALTHLHTERTAAVNKLGNIPLTVAIAPWFREQLEDKSRLIKQRLKRLSVLLVASCKFFSYPP